MEATFEEEDVQAEYDMENSEVPSKWRRVKVSSGWYFTYQMFQGSNEKIK